MPHKRHQNIGLGGTFDHLHAGHQALIKFAAGLGEKLIIGVCDESMAKGKFLAQTIEPLTVRKRAVGQYCQKTGINIDITTLYDPLGPAIKAESYIDALVVTPETLTGGNQINVVRDKLKLRQLPIYICPLVNDISGQPIHSDRIRAGQVSRTGLIYDQPLNQSLIISARTRQLLQHLKLNLVESPSPDIPPAPITAVVGDVTLKKFIDHNWPFQIGVFDNLVERKTQHLVGLTGDQTVNNPAGQITSALTEPLTTATINQITKNSRRSIIQVVGEEDLASVALILLLPLYSRLYFGLPGQGLVEVTITENLKDKIYGMLTV